MLKKIVFCFYWLLYFSGQNSLISFDRFIEDFATKYVSLEIPQFQYDYRDYFNSIPTEKVLDKQQDFFTREKSMLSDYSKVKINSDQQITYDHIQYEINYNLQRIALEKAWVNNGRKIPTHGLSALADGKAWYSLFIKRFTGLNLTPEEIMEMGKKEVERVKNEIKKIQIESGFQDSIAFYEFLKSDKFIITDKEKLIAEFQKTHDTILANLSWFIGDLNLPEVYPVEWADAGPNTPPGMYINHNSNTFGKDVFQYNFYGGKFNSRAVEWLYMHEAIPGHHLQWSFPDSGNPDSIQNLFSYPGSFEGWACYVEYYGKELGVYRDKYSYLGKWEWDLVRSARLVIDAGIHYYGWSSEEALAYWKKNIPGQNEIAEREISRVTNWTAQALSYKAGADCILKMKDALKKKYGSRFDEVKFNRCYVSFGMRPLEVIKKNFERVYLVMK